MKHLPVCLALLLVPAGLIAADKPKFEPFEDTAPDSKLFPEIQAEARRLNDLVRDALIAPTPESIANAYPKERVQAFGTVVKEEVGKRLDGPTFPALPVQLKNFEATLARWTKAGDRMPAFAVIQPGEQVLYFFDGDDDNQGQFKFMTDDKIVVHTAQGDVTEQRKAALVALQEAIYPYQRNANAYTAYKTSNLLQDMADEWDAYFEKARPQTFWDVTITTLIEYKHLKVDHLVGPPDRQWFVLHPNVVVENVDAAPDGDQLGGAVAIEWFGVNWWKLKVPLGISVSSLYSDRPGVKDVGHGVTIYIANKYCVGWASHGGDNGFYASVDALMFIDSKKSKLESYRSQLAAKLSVPDLN